MNDLERFVEAQKHSYLQALTEISNGSKQGHWIWYIFPQLKGFGSSYNSEYYGITDTEEAKSYLNHPTLGKRLREITDALLLVVRQNNSLTAIGILSYIDAQKLQSCMTLFEAVSGEKRFSEVLEMLYRGERDLMTLSKISK